MPAKLTILLSLAILGSPLISQAQFRIGPTLGLNLSSLQHSRDFREDLRDDDTNVSPRLRLRLGAIAEYALLDQLYLQSGLIVNGGGVKYRRDRELQGTTVELSTKTLLTYLDIPLTARYQVAELDNIALSAWGGFVIGVAVSGRFKNETSANGETESNSESINFGSGNTDYLKRSDFRLALGMVAESYDYPVQLKVGIDQGLANAISNPRDGYAQRNFMFSISAAYLFELD